VNAKDGRREFGRMGEEVAARYLEANGYGVLARNYRREGCEVDIICRAPCGCLVFTEVKTRSRGTYGEGFEAVERVKQARIVKVSLSYISEHVAGDCDIRYDVVSVTIGGFENTIEHFVNAFDAC